MILKSAVGTKVYMIENNINIREVTVVSCRGGFFIIKFQDGGGIQIKGHRLFTTRDEATQNLEKSTSNKVKIYKSPYDYPH